MVFGLEEMVPYLLVLMKILLIFVSIVFLISGIDELFIDLCFVGRSLYRRIFVLPRYSPLKEETLLAQHEKPIAVMIPAWDESAVIRPMLKNTLRSLNYSNYHLFVGTYPNDPATHTEVEHVREQHDRVHRTVCPHDGPTNKADCLNWIYQGIKVFEKENNIQFEIFVMQDCEDVIHPLCYKLFNHLIPRKDMVQLPVLSLETKWYQFTAGHYLDEFSQGHYKDMVVREYLNRSIPAAGTGCAFSRRAFECVAKGNHNQLFSLDSLTEDYDFGFRLKEYNLKQIFVKFPVQRSVTKQAFWTGKPKRVTTREYVGIREYFPATFRTAVRQKSRWVIGIVFQGWSNIGWKGGLWTRYMLFRDRKALITNLVSLLGYLVVIVVVAVWLMIWIDPSAYRYPPLLERDTWVWYLILVNALFLVLRAFQRAYCVYQLYDWKQALLSLPRMIWGNVINFMATSRAIRLYIRYLVTGKLITWDKTAHAYPSESELLAYRRKLGDLLLEKRVITVNQLEVALNHQRKTHKPLGAILSEMGVLSDEVLKQTLAIQ